jgi:hypothetical protein
MCLWAGFFHNTDLLSKVSEYQHLIVVIVGVDIVDAINSDNVLFLGDNHMLNSLLRGGHTVWVGHIENLCDT